MEPRRNLAFRSLPLTKVVGIAWSNGSCEMIVIDETEQPLKLGRRRRMNLHLPETRPSILHPCLESEPTIEKCPCSETLVLFSNKHPIALIEGTSLDHTALTMRLYQLRHRWPRRS